MTNLINCTR